MLKKVVKTYYKLLDEKLENGTMVVLIIALLIIAISFFIRNSESNLFLKSNLLESNKIISYNINKDNFIDINGIKYKIILKETNSEK